MWTDCNLTGAVLIGSNYEDITILGEGTNTGNSFVAVTLDQLSIINSIPDKVTITPDQSNAILANTTRSQNNESRLNNNIGELIEGDRFNLSKIRENTTAIEQQAIEILTNATRSKQNQFDIENSLGELVEGDRFNLSRIRENTSKIENHDTIINSMRDEIETIKAQLQTLVASVAEKDAQIAEKDAKIAELEQGGGGQSLEQVLEQVRDARAGSVVLTVDPDGDNITLGLTIEQSDNLIEWTKLDGEMTRTIPIPDGKKFYRFALDK